MRTKFAVLVAMFSLIGSGVALRAHHSFSTEYDGTKTFNFKGTVSKVEWTNPHVRFYVDIVESWKDEDLEHGAGEPQRARAQRLDEPDVEGWRHGDGQGYAAKVAPLSRQRAFGHHGRRPIALRRRRR